MTLDFFAPVSSATMPKCSSLVSGLRHSERRSPGSSISFVFQVNLNHSSAHSKTSAPAKCSCSMADIRSAVLAAESASECPPWLRPSGPVCAMPSALGWPNSVTMTAWPL